MIISLMEICTTPVGINCCWFLQSYDAVLIFIIGSTDYRQSDYELFGHRC